MTPGWNVQLGGEYGEPQSAIDVATAADGSSYVVGSCQGAAEVVDTVFGIDCAAAGEHGFLLRLDERGAPDWVKPLDSSAFANRMAVAVAPDGVWIAGGFGEGTVSTLYLSNCAPLASSGDRDAFVAKLTPGGDCMGGVAFGGGLADYATDIVALPDGGAVVTGRFHGTMAIEPPLATQIANGDTFVIRLDADANTAWAVKLNAGAVNETDVRVAHAGGDVFVAGTFIGPFDREPPPGAGRNVFVARFNAELGALEEHQVFGGLQEDRLLDVTTGSTGPALLISFEKGELTVGDKTLTSNGKNLVVIGLTTSLQPTFALDLDGNVTEGSLVADPSSDDLLFAVTSTAGVAGTPGCGADRDVYLGRVGCRGQVRWLERLGDANGQDAKGAAIFADGSLLVGGDFAGHITFGGDDDFASTGRDGFVARYLPSP